MCDIDISYYNTNNEREREKEKKCVWNKCLLKIKEAKSEEKKKLNLS